MTQSRDFWSRRRAAVQAEEAALAVSMARREEAEDQAALEARDDAEILAELNLPDPDDLKAGDDIRGFMMNAVPERLRRRALRRLWRLNPVLANVDGLVDYGEDFTDSATVLETMQTSYQVGKGMLEHVREMARQAERDAAEEPLDLAAEEVAGPFETAEDATPVENTWREPETQAAEAEQDERPAPAPRRMRFEFEPEPCESRRT